MRGPELVERQHSLGKLTVREMLFFTVYHQHHHIAAAERRRTA